MIMIMILYFWLFFCGVVQRSSAGSGMCALQTCTWRHTWSIKEGLSLAFVLSPRDFWTQVHWSLRTCQFPRGKTIERERNLEELQHFWYELHHGACGVFSDVTSTTKFRMYYRCLAFWTGNCDFERARSSSTGSEREGVILERSFERVANRFRELIATRFVASGTAVFNVDSCHDMVRSSCPVVGPSKRYTVPVWSLKLRYYCCCNTQHNQPNNRLYRYWSTTVQTDVWVILWAQLTIPALL